MIITRRIFTIRSYCNRYIHAAHTNKRRLTDWQGRPSHNTARATAPINPHRAVYVTVVGPKFAPPNPLIYNLTVCIYIYIHIRRTLENGFVRLIFFVFKNFITALVQSLYVLYTHVLQYRRGLDFRGGTKIACVGGNGHYAPTPAAPGFYAL